VETLRGIVDSLCFDSYKANAGLGADLMGQCLDRINYEEVLQAFED
jgi:hypothetical protein